MYRPEFCFVEGVQTDADFQSILLTERDEIRYRLGPIGINFELSIDGVNVQMGAIEAHVRPVANHRFLPVGAIAIELPSSPIDSALAFEFWITPRFGIEILVAMVGIPFGCEIVHRRAVGTMPLGCRRRCARLAQLLLLISSEFVESLPGRRKGCDWIEDREHHDAAKHHERPSRMTRECQLRSGSVWFGLLIGRRCRMVSTFRPVSPIIP